MTASEDKVLQWGKYENEKKQLPADTHFVTIEGGNHNGFGLYSQQRKDGIATISASQQRDMNIQEIVDCVETSHNHP
nr:alpha/beta hydrolase [Streptococcus respiraculi]